MIILGIDPGLHKTGWGLIEAANNNLKYINCGVITTNPKDLIDNRLHLISVGLSRIVMEYSPKECAIEETFVNNNPSTSLKLGLVRGAIFLTIKLSDINVNQYAPKLVKKTIVGLGQASKDQVAAMLKFLLTNYQKTTSNDANDALAVAICHALYSQNRHKIVNNP